MSSDERQSRSWRDDPGTVLEGPLVGVKRRRTAITIAYVAALIALFTASYAGTAITIDATQLDPLTPRFDSLSALLIALATATMVFVPLGYALWNGGPAMSVALALLPVVLGDVAAGRYVFDLDTAIALTVGASAGALALLATDVRRRGSIRPWRVQPVDENALLFVTATTVVAAVGVARFVVAAPEYIREWYAPAGLCWPVAIGILAVYWYLWATTVAERTERQPAGSSPRTDG
ncbi:hypothetical protein [Halopiger djelfimassiliensis]|uniref:hypothetical protein n=1 Tax=Halopiger djelfimassiliensis TaxID=1293047 RepID=UPI0006779471|nr:hypothetical protein [Halopiger djelfimassiliensis]